MNYSSYGNYKSNHIGSSLFSLLNSYVYIPLRRKTIRIGSWHCLGPPTPQFCVTYTNMLVSKNAKICVTPNANAKFQYPQRQPQRKSVEYKLRWVPKAKFSRWQCTFVFFLC